MKLRPVTKPAENLVAPPAPAQSAERAALAVAIASHAELQARCNAAYKARDTADRAIWAARECLDAAPELIERAKANAAKALVDGALGVASPTSQSIREARNVLQDAEDELEAAEASRAALRTEEDSLGRAMLWSQSKVQIAAEAVVRAEAANAAQALAAEVVRLQDEMLRQGQALEWLASRGALPVVEEHGSLHGQVRDPGVRIAIERMMAAPFRWNLEDVDARPGADAWRAALVALQFDAMAPLPVVLA
ncbi:MAG: hypothetical protein ACRYHQ_32150, partial [Janthinobacterium lividum]